MKGVGNRYEEYILKAGDWRAYDTRNQSYLAAINLKCQDSLSFYQLVPTTLCDIHLAVQDGEHLFLSMKAAESWARVLPVCRPFYIRRGVMCVYVQCDFGASCLFMTLSAFSGPKGASSPLIQDRLSSLGTSTRMPISLVSNSCMHVSLTKNHMLAPSPTAKNRW